jgi:copper homeostasis protein CutC
MEIQIHRTRNKAQTRTKAVTAMFRSHFTRILRCCSPCSKLPALPLLHQMLHNKQELYVNSLIGTQTAHKNTKPSKAGTGMTSTNMNDMPHQATTTELPRTKYKSVDTSTTARNTPHVVSHVNRHHIACNVANVSTAKQLTGAHENGFHFRSSSYKLFLCNVQLLPSLILHCDNICGVWGWLPRGRRHWRRVLL